MGIEKMNNKKVNKRVTNIYKKVLAECKSIGVDFATISLGDIDTNKVYQCNTNNAVAYCRCFRTATTKKFFIFYSNMYLELTDKEIASVMAHELVHTLPNCFNHGMEFKRYMRLINKELGYNINTSFRGSNAKRLDEICKKGIACKGKNMPASLLTDNDDTFLGKSLKAEMPTVEKEMPKVEIPKPKKEIPTTEVKTIAELMGKSMILQGIEGLEVELKGTWLWIGGNTYPNKDRIKALGGRWAAKRKMWYIVG